MKIPALNGTCQRMSWKPDIFLGEHKQQAPEKRMEGLTHLRPANLSTIKAGDGINQVVGFINDHNLVLQLNPRCISGSFMQQHLIWQHHQLQERHRLQPQGTFAPLVLPAAEQISEAKQNTREMGRNWAYQHVHHIHVYIHQKSEVVSTPTVLRVSSKSLKCGERSQQKHRGKVALGSWVYLSLLEARTILNHRSYQAQTKACQIILN